MFKKRFMGCPGVITFLLAIGSISLPFIVAEWGTMRWLRHRGEDAHPFFYDKSQAENNLPAMQQNWGEHLVVSYLDPHLGFAHDNTAHPLLGNPPGFAIYRSKKISGNDAPCLRIVALGGSTTDPLTALHLGDPEADKNDPYNWPQALQEELEKRGICAEVFNGGVAGYSSNQDLLKFIRDVLPLEPGVVIFLEGVNEVGFAHSVQEHPMVHRYQKSFLEEVTRKKNSFLLPNTVAFLNSLRKEDKRQVRGYSMGPAVKTTPAEQWARNARLAAAIARESDIALMVVLQPILGFGKYPMNEREQEQLHARGDGYLKQVQDFYAHASALCAAMPFALNLTDVFADMRGVYLDPRHQNRMGVEILATAVANALETRGLLLKDKQ